jgi:hypothetical protein
VGTALTLLGGLPQWLLDHPDRLGPVLMALSSVIQTHVDTLSRNAATAIYRLCQHTPLAQHLLNAQRPWVEGLLQLYQSSGGVRKRIGELTKWLGYPPYLVVAGFPVKLCTPSYTTLQDIQRFSPLMYSWPALPYLLRSR